MIQTRNSFGENRKSGRDDWIVNIQRKLLSADGKTSFQEIPFELVDNNNGQYEVRYLIDAPCEALIHVKLTDELSKHRPIRGSPFKPTFVQDGKHRANEY